MYGFEKGDIKNVGAIIGVVGIVIGRGLGGHWDVEPLIKVAYENTDWKVSDSVVPGKIFRIPITRDNRVIIKSE